MGFVSASAPGKCILFGEHAVVYGHPAVAVAIEQRISVKIQPSQTGTWLLDGSDFNMKRNPHLKALIYKLWPGKKGAPPLSIHIEGNIPRASGLGSSAALSVASAAALRFARGRWLKENSSASDHNSWAEGFSSKIDDTDPYGKGDGLLDSIEEDGLIHVTGEQSVDKDECALLAHSVEAWAQNGRASPIDSSTCSHGEIVIISDVIEDDLNFLYTRRLEMPEGKRKWQIHDMKISHTSEEVYLVIGNTGVHAPTSKQVEKVALMLEKHPSRMEEINTIGHIARRGIQALKVGDYDAVGRTMSENQIMLKSIGVSSPELDTLIKAATPSSLGAKLTGAGGGGCMIALTRNPEETSNAIELAGGRTLISKLGAQGLSINSFEDIPIWTIAKD